MATFTYFPAEVRQNQLVEQAARQPEAATP
jgi:hypothetical protein